ncbi:MAG TPA: TolC family protein [Chthoniobacterales bacterium]|nr:TolC family protein [Chthoniobacterales bacterium]
MDLTYCDLTKHIGSHFRLLAIAGLIGFQMTFIQAGHAQSTPAIPEAQPSPTPTSPRPEEFPQHHGTRNEIQPLIPPGQLPSPTPSPAPGASPGNNQIVGGITDQQAAEFDKRFETALALNEIIPPGLFPLRLIDAVRLALSKNKDLRLSIEDTQSARGNLKARAGVFDLTAAALANYSYTVPAIGTNTALNNQNQVLNTALPRILQSAGIPVSVATVANAINNATSQQETKPSETLVTDLSLSKQFRNGVTLGVTYEPEWSDQAGNLKYPPTSNVILLTATVPLWKKAGTLYNDSEEINARISYEGTLQTLRNDAQKAALNTAQAYWALVAALDKFALQDRAFRVDAILAQLSQEMAEGGGVAFSEVTLAKGRESQAFAQRVQALVSVYDAARKLGVTIGLRANELKKLPFALQQFPKVEPRDVGSLNTDALVDAALARRQDRAAALSTIKAKQVLLDKAKMDLFPSPQLTGTIGSTINNEKVSLFNASERGTKVGLDASMLVMWAWPFANNSAEGGVISAQSDVNTAVITMEDLSSNIAANVTESADTLQELARDVESQEKAVVAFKKSFDDMREKFRRGATTMFETIQSEEQLTTAQSELVDFQLALANALVQLRYETSTLLSGETVIRTPGFPQGLERTTISEKAFETVPDIKQPIGPVLKDRNYEPDIKHVSGRPPWQH